MVILFDQANLPEDIFQIVFATDQQYIVAKELIKAMKAKKGEFTKTEMSLFATKLHEGSYECMLDTPEYKGQRVRLSYNKRQFYDRILTPMMGMGLIDYNVYKKTYLISRKFKDSMMRIGLMWIKELEK
ncbi:hypothetical protein HY639_00155 [Candidatus Woesearchaeota archaeon]|nr:hypothetical protein [Candidatus Woesearchaeota archaeon]